MAKKSDESANEIQAAIDLGITHEELVDPILRHQWLKKMGESMIWAATEKYGPDSTEAQAAIDEANRQSVIVTNAAAVALADEVEQA